MVTLMTEPYTCDNKITGLPRGTKMVYHRSKNPGGEPRAGIASTPDVSLTAMDSWCNRDCAIALAKVGGKRTVLVSLYLDIQKEVQPGWLDSLMDMIDSKGYPVILGIDSNAHSTLYGSDSNRRGEAFEDFIMQYGLGVENRGTTPTFETRRGDKMIGTHIDVTLTRGVTADIQNWRVCTEYNASDLNTIKFETQTQKPEPTLIRPWSKTDWGIFADTLSKADYWD